MNEEEFNSLRSGSIVLNSENGEEYLILENSDGKVKSVLFNDIKYSDISFSSKYVKQPYIRRKELKLLAGRILGIRNIDNNFIPEEECTAETLLFKYAMLKQFREHSRTLDTDLRNVVDKKIRNLVKAKLLANKRADVVEKQLKEIRRKLDGVIEIKQ